MRAWVRALLIVIVTAPAYAGAFVLSDFQNLLARNPQTGRPTQNIKELLTLLPAENPRKFHFVYDSPKPFRDSISPDYPRVLIFSDDARFVLSFTGNPNKPGYGIVETMAFNDNTATFNFDAYMLPEAARRKVHVSAESLQCERCHGADARPIYDSYPLWPGFYGSVQDTFPPSSSVGQREAHDYRHFVANTARTGVYKYLRFRTNRRSRLTSIRKTLFLKKWSADASLSSVLAQHQAWDGAHRVESTSIARKLFPNARLCGARVGLISTPNSSSAATNRSPTNEKLRRDLHKENGAG